MYGVDLSTVTPVRQRGGDCPDPVICPPVGPQAAGDASILRVLNLSNASSTGKSAWVEVADVPDVYSSTSGLAFDADSFQVFIGSNAATQPTFIVDVGVGPPGEQELLVADLVHHLGVRFHHSYYTVPKPIPAGSRVWLRQYNSTAAAASWAGLMLNDGGIGWPELDVVPLNVSEVAPSSLGIQLLHSAANPVQVVASVPRDLVALLPVVVGQIGSSNWGSLIAYDDGVRCAASHWGRNAGTPPPPFWLPCSIAAGSELAALVTASSAGTDGWRVCFYGLAEPL